MSNLAMNIVEDAPTPSADLSQLDDFLTLIKTTAERVMNQGREDMSGRFAVIHGDITAMQNLVACGMISEDHARREIIKLMNYCLADLLPTVK